MEFIKAIIKPSYWITHQYPVPEEWKIGLTVFFGVLLALGLITSIASLLKSIKKPYQRLLAKLASWAWTMSLLGYVLLFFSVERVSFVSARLFYLFWAVIAIWWLVLIIRYAVTDIPRLVENQQKKDDSKKYLPQKKK